MKTNTKFWHCLFILLTAMLFTTTTKAQVTIGDEVDPQSYSVLELVSGGNKGLRLPQLTTAQRDALTVSSAKELSHGLMIYNKTTGCVEYYNGVANKWISTCSGNVDFQFSCNTLSILPATNAKISDCQIIDPSCSTTTPWTYEFVFGAEYATLAWKATPADGRFDFTFTDNPTAAIRKAVLLFTSPCGNQKMVTFTQEAGSGCVQPAFAETQTNKAVEVTIDSPYTLSFGNVTGDVQSYQWYKDDVAITTNGNSMTYNKGGQNWTAADAGVYYCKVAKQAGCGGGSMNSATFTVTMKVDFTKLDAGAGTLTGKTCFDIAESNDNANGCGALAGRKAVRANFNNQTTYEQTYTFTPSGTVSKVRFAYVETNGAGKIIQSITPTSSSYVTETNISTACTVKVTYKTSLSSPNPDSPTTATALGLEEARAFTVDIYAIYNDAANGNGTDKTVKLTSQVKDCACCGAMTAEGTWLNFMCHNLGADETLNPFTWDNSKGNADGSDIKGDLYQWGRRKDGHEKRNSGTTTTLAPNNKPTHGLFIKSATGGWVSGGTPTSSWGDDTQNAHMAKGVNDPCPTGWKVPSNKQWHSIFSSNLNTHQSPLQATANNWTWTGNGYRIGQQLYLPAAGIRYCTDGKLGLIGECGSYYSSTGGGGYALILEFYSNLIFPDDGANYFPDIHVGIACSVRCVEE